MLKISSTDKGSISRELKIRAGYSVIDFDGYAAEDIIDYLYYDAKEKFTLRVADKKGREFVFEIEKDEDESLGMSFEDDGLSIKTCHNNCIFCFVDQMPKGMRDSLYVKDDDYRQSFLCGNFVTLTNLKQSDKDRIIRYKLSPLYISVHTMNESLRAEMMNNRFAGKIVEYIKDFAGAGIEMHTQIVLVPNANDGKELEYSTRELFKLYPQVKTLAVVPCGITRYREGLTEINDTDVDYAMQVVTLADRLNKEFGVNFLTLADEFYYKAGIPVKPYEFYGEFPQIENGVGMTAKFRTELEETLEEREYEKTFLVLTGTSAKGFIKDCCEKVEKYCKGLKTHVIGVENKFFGSTVNCTGLLTGGDLSAAVTAFDQPFDEVVIASNTLKEFEDVFLDGMTLDEFKRATKKPVRVTVNCGDAFFETLTSPYSGR